MRKLVVVFTICLVALGAFLQGCTSPENPTPGSGKNPEGVSSTSTNAAVPTGPIVVGVITEVTGSLAGTGEAQTTAIKMAVEEWNEKGGINGRLIDLAIEDDSSNPSGASNALNRLIAKKKPMALFGPAFTNLLMAVEPILKEAAIPVVTGATGVSVTSSGNPWFFRVRTDDAAVSRLAAQVAVKEFGYKKIGIIHVTGEFGNAGAKVVRESLEKLGVPPVEVEWYNVDDEDVSAELRSLQEAGAEMVIGWAYPADAGVVMTSLSRLGAKMKLLGSPAYGTANALSIAKQAANGTYVVTDWLPSKDQATQDWIKKIESRQKQKVSFINAVYYDGANILFRAIQKAGTDPQEIRKAILATKGYKGVAGEYSFDGNGDGLRQVYVAEIKDGKPVLTKVVKEQ